MSIKVSVIVPTHNTGKTVLDGLASLRAQSLPRSEFEVIYVDDGSTDDTPELLATELAGEENFRLIRSRNSGWPGRPRNLGMDAARGGYLYFLDDDDYLAPEALARLYARAVETGADIVAGRMAGHGRGAPRVLFSRPMAAGDVRRDTVLLSSMTVHKLFRRELLTAHGIRFPEGRVRLEDHMFTLRAYLAAGTVATVHDYTCYHWVRHEDGKHNISFRRIDPWSYLDSVRTIIGIVEEHLEPGPLRNRFIARWYAGKALERLQGQKFLGRPAGYRRQVVAAVSALAAERVPLEVDAVLPAKQRIMSALVRHGDPALLEEYAAFESGITHRPRLEGLRWLDGRLLVRFSTELVRPGGRHGPVPVLFDRTDGRYRWQLPPAVAAVPGVAVAADFTSEVPHGRAAGQFRHREEATELLLPSGCRITDFPSTDPEVWPGAAPAPRRGSLLGRLLRRRIPVAAALDAPPEPVSYTHLT
ncbi:glycosyltransferase family 2 protein, partial [Streptomyces palmae]